MRRWEVQGISHPPPTRGKSCLRYLTVMWPKRGRLSKASDAQLMEAWSLLAGGKTIFTLPRIAVLRGMVMNHMIHHRAQLGVYLRLNDLPVPALYGPSADETGS